ncbi:hypothetical protein COL154_010123 [Colletotrichum chrysophilum]|uniref:uncharacterized protein n=1 Tax=Colletotrichum chrysophilum TaxID=1836956 RepID=UPI002301862B|nr:uncharacterized protein COL26b_011030 [Colletotrichum chrysophilum]KAJ0350766.1 hypothetical protein KNSL1_003677 [Colletotrichum chrysophilum]KAJ0357425.1 hypothetical protein COL154_010123 [Colletotrichum chrysophilum]KAJ0367962.1 hypothetical protein COL26b_011030 [Colletotrichum chrysophilum]
MSRFVSAGAINAETGEAVAAAEGESKAVTSTTGSGDAGQTRKNAEWEAVQKELDAERKRREEARVKAVEGGERSLYDVLQANKAAKQAAFEEANKIKNQFRPLDDDEIEFLDEVREAKRAEEERVRRETEEGLAAFRRAQLGKRPADGDAADGDSGAGEKGGDEGEGGGEEEWAVGRKRRRRERVGFGVKKAGEEKKGEGDGGSKSEGKEDDKAKEVEKVKASAPLPAPVKPKMGLVAYGSDSDDE